MINAQRAESGPLLSLSFWEEQLIDSTIFDTPIELQPRFNPPRFWFVESLVAGNWNDSDGNPVSPERVVKCKVRNVQTNDTGVAHRVEIEILGAWGLAKGDNEFTSRMIDLHSTPFSLLPGEEKELDVIEIGEVSLYSLGVRKLSYSDLWGHQGHAFTGEYGILQIHKSAPPKSWPGTWPDAASDDLVKLEWQYRWWLARESLLVMTDSWRGTPMGRLISHVYSKFRRRS